MGFPYQGAVQAPENGTVGLTSAQRPVKGMLDSEHHRLNPAGLALDQVCFKAPFQALVSSILFQA